jgi:hypothetical protein
MLARSDLRVQADMTTTSGTIPEDVLEALDNGDDLTRDQLRRVIEAEAAGIGLTFDEAVELAHRRALPRNATGIGLQVLIPISFHGVQVRAQTDDAPQPATEPAPPLWEVAPLPEHLTQAIEDGFLSDEYLNEIIAFQANPLGLTFDEAIRRGRRWDLPKHLLGLDLQGWINMWLDIERQRQRSQNADRSA